MSNIRTRFAPSPTGYMHVGGVRTALFAWLIARSANGKFILRIEDTDKNREVDGSIAQIETALKWLGLDWDEGVDIGGDFGPYLQSERLEIYKQWAQKLVEAGRAYADPYSPAQIEQFREEAKRNKKPFLYRNYRPENPPIWDGSRPLRFKSAPQKYNWNDAVMGDLKSSEDAIDDFILIKSDGFPTYNFCHIIDDHLMQVSHVLRSQEFLSSVPKFLNLYEALQIERPILATLPFVMAIDGSKKLGKRDGAKDILQYAGEGFLPEAMLNFLATLGWNDGSEQEIFSIKELIDKFSLERVQKSPARFDERRLLWLNGQHIRRLTLAQLLERSQGFWPESAESASDQQKLQILALVQDRLKTLADLPTLTNYFFTEPTPNWAMTTDNRAFKNYSRVELADLLKTALKKLQQTDFNDQELQTTLNQLLAETNQKPAVLLGIIRLSVTWSPFSPALNQTLRVIGKDKALARIEKAIEIATSS